MNSPVRAPIVLLPDPAAGWGEAGPIHRGFAVGAPVCVVLALLGWTLGFASLIALTALAAVPCFGAAARVLRPYPPGTPTLERRLRHGAAAVATALGSTYLLIFLPELAYSGSYESDPFDTLGGTIFLGWLLATVLGPVTVVWGLISVLVRSISRLASPRPPSPATPVTAIPAAGTDYGYGNPPPPSGE